jgi:hypothetical protein
MSVGLVVIAALGAFGLLRPDLWSRCFFSRIDPRPAGLLRIAVGAVTLWTFLALGRYLRLFFTDEGLLLPGMAREISRGPLRYLWDPERGFEHWWSPLEALVGSSSILQLRSDPWLVFTLYGLLLVSAALLTMGAWTRISAVTTWALAEQLYRYDPTFANGGDLVIRAFLFLGMLSGWGEAYSVDAWRRRRAALLGGATEIPPLRRIAAWPLRLMMVQLAVIYFVNGAMKTGQAWRNGTALYYALNLDHFYRVPAQSVVTWLQWLGVLPMLTWLTRYWELCFPVALLGAALRAYEAERAAGRWEAVPEWRRTGSWAALGAGGVAAMALGYDPIIAVVGGLGVALLVALYRILRARAPRAHRALLCWVLSKRVWLGFGLGVHLGIDAGMNIGTFPQIMMATYLAWLSGPEVAAFWRALLAHAPRITVRHHPGEIGVRRAALLRLFDHGSRLDFVADPAARPGALRVEPRATPPTLEGWRAALALLDVLPALWWLRPARWIPPLRAPAGRLALRLLGQAA